MSEVNKLLPLLLIAILAFSSLLTVKPANAQSIPKPAVPEFTLKVVAHPYDVAPETTIDPYTGETKITNHGYHDENKSVEIKILNQAFTPYWLDSSQQQWIMLFYNITYKGHYEDTWQYYAIYGKEPFYFSQSTSEYSIFSFSPLPDEGQLDFRIQAQIGYYDYYYMPYKVYTFHGETSGWSNAQTITVTEINPTLTPTDTPHATSNEPTDNSITLPLTTLALTILVAVLVPSLVFIIFYRKRQRGKPNE